MSSLYPEKDLVFVRILEKKKKTYLVELEECKCHMHGRIVLNKREKLLTYLDVYRKLDLAWKSLGSWKAISFDKEFYEFSFTSS